MTVLKFRELEAKYLDGKTVEEFCDKLKKWADENVPKDAVDVSYYLTSRDDYGSSQGIIEVSFKSPETPDEAAIREAHQRRREEWDRQQYLVLKAKFENKSQSD